MQNIKITEFDVNLNIPSCTKKDWPKISNWKIIKSYYAETHGKIANKLIAGSHLLRYELLCSRAFFLV